jgi:hypothetical protein
VSQPHLDRASAERRERLRRRGWWLLCAALLATLFAWVVLDSTAKPAPASPQVEARAPAPAPSAPTPPTRAPFSAAGEQTRQAQLALWRLRLAQAQSTLESYRAGSRYPRSSQPLVLHGDQADPNRPVAEEQALSASPPRGRDGVRLQTSQERVYVQGNESVRFTVAARDASGAVAPLRVLHASAREIPPANAGSLYPVVPMNFNDEGQDGDQAGGDGSFGVVLQPESRGFAGLSGQIRVEAALQVGDQQGTTYFDIFYTSAPPATWSGSAREALADGSLQFTWPVNVHEPGRYVVKARLDDANGVPLALLSFNDELAAGAQEIRMTLFGKLVRDAQPAFPLVVRDVDGFLLRPDAFPDRSLMPRLAGNVHTTQEYALAAFSEAEWDGEERQRYLAELGRDVEQAEQQVRRLSQGS